MGRLLENLSEIDGLDDWIAKNCWNTRVIFLLPMIKFKVSSLVHEQRCLQQQEKRRIFPIHFEVWFQVMN